MTGYPSFFPLKWEERGERVHSLGFPRGETLTELLTIGEQGGEVLQIENIEKENLLFVLQNRFVLEYLSKIPGERQKD